MGPLFRARYVGNDIDKKAVIVGMTLMTRHGIRIAGTAALLLVLPLVLAACGGGGGGNGAAAGSEFHIEAKEYEFSPNELRAEGSKIVIHLSNVGVIEHDLQIRGVDDAYVYTAPGESAALEITLPAGTYEFYCTVPGHFELGMQGTLVVSD